jgi:hypothetical protein
MFSCVCMTLLISIVLGTTLVTHNNYKVFVARH